MVSLNDYHHTEEKPDRTQRIVSLVAMALVLAGAAFYVMQFEMRTEQPNQVAKPHSL